MALRLLKTKIYNYSIPGILVLHRKLTKTTITSFRGFNTTIHTNEGRSYRSGMQLPDQCSGAYINFPQQYLTGPVDLSVKPRTKQSARCR